MTQTNSSQQALKCIFKNKFFALFYLENAKIFSVGDTTLPLHSIFNHLCNK